MQFERGAQIPITAGHANHFSAQAHQTFIRSYGFDLRHFPSKENVAAKHPFASLVWGACHSPELALEPFFLSFGKLPRLRRRATARDSQFRAAVSVESKNVPPCPRVAPHQNSDWPLR